MSTTTRRAAGTTSEVAVVGAGIVGLAVTHALREAGIDVVCFEAGEPGQGQSAGSSRVFRHLVATPELAALAAESRPAWDAWSERAGERLLCTDGWLRRGGDRTADLALLRGAGVAATELQPDDAVARMPLIERSHEPLLLDPLGGHTRVEATVAALVRWIGPALRRSRVEAVTAQPGGNAVTLRTADGTHTCARCLICAGAGTDRLAATAGLRVLQGRRAHLRVTFRCRAATGAPLPAWSDRSGVHGELVYGLPAEHGTYALGIATLDASPEAAAGSEAVAPGTAVSAARRRIVAYARAAFPGLHPDPIGEVLRLTTTLPGRGDDAFSLWRDGPVGAFAGGNLFKFAPVLGVRLADAMLGEDSPLELAYAPEG
jgi:sarcosine oxidase